MSAFAAFIHLDGRPIDRDRMQRPLAAMVKHGPDGAREIRVGSAGFAHRLLAITQADNHETQPLSDPAGDLVFAGNVRLFNREDVAAALGVDALELPTTSDGQLAFSAYRKWGPECVDRMIGDFGFIVWNRHNGEIFAATDPFSRKPVFYHLDATRFIAASTIGGITCHPEVPLDLDARRFAALAICYLQQSGRTHFQTVRYVPAGHTMRVHAGQAQFARYWHPDQTAPLKLTDRGAYAEAYRALLDQVTRQHLEGIGKVALMFSGGLDSSSLAAIAKPALQAQQRDLVCFTGVAPADLANVQHDARRWAELVGTHLDLDVHFITSEDKSLLGDPISDVRHGERLPWHLFGIYNWIYDAARQAGASIIVDGLAGDYGASVKAQGAFLPALKRGDLVSAFRDARTEWRHRGRQFIPKYAARTTLELIAPNLLAWIQQRFRGRGLKNWLSPLKPDFVVQSGLRSDLEQGLNFYYQNQKPLGARALMLMNIQAASAEPWNLVDYQTEHFGLESRQPYTDRRLIEFALASPEDQHFEAGWNRALLRNAMKADLPRELIWRTESNSMAIPDVPQRMLQAKSALLDLSHELEQSAPFSDGFDWAYIRQTLADYDGSGGSATLDKTLRASLAISAAQMAKIVSGRN